MNRVDEGVLVLTAGYTDAGAEGAPALRGESTIVLHSRRKKAALYDVNYGMQYVEQVEGEKGIIGHFNNDDAIVFRELNLKGINNIIVRAGGLEKAGHNPFYSASIFLSHLTPCFRTVILTCTFVTLTVTRPHSKGNPNEFMSTLASIYYRFHYVGNFVRERPITRALRIAYI